MRPRTIRVIRVLAAPVAAVAALALTGYVADSGSDSVIPFDTALNRPGQPIAVGGSPGALLVSPDGQYAWVASLAIKPNSFSVWATAGNPSASRTEIVPIGTSPPMQKGELITFSPGPGAGPAPLVYSPYTKNLYTASALGTVTEILPHASQVGRVIPFGFKDAHGTAHLALGPDGKVLYAFGSDPAQTVTTVTPVNLVTGKAGHPVSTVAGKAAPAINLGSTAASVWASIMLDGAKLYVSARWAGHYSNSVFSVSTATKTILKEVRPSNQGPIAFTPDDATAFIIEGGSGLGAVVSVTTATDTYHPGFPVGEEPVAITIAP